MLLMSVVNGIVTRGLKLQQKVTSCPAYQKKLFTKGVLRQWNMLSVEISGAPQSLRTICNDNTVMSCLITGRSLEYILSSFLGLELYEIIFINYMLYLRLRNYVIY